MAVEVRPFRKGKKGSGSPRTKKIATLTYKVVLSEAAVLKSPHDAQLSGG